MDWADFLNADSEAKFFFYLITYSFTSNCRGALQLYFLLKKLSLSPLNSAEIISQMWFRIKNKQWNVKHKQWPFPSIINKIFLICNLIWTFWKWSLCVMVKLSGPQHLGIPCYADAKMIILSRVSECMNHSFSMYAKLSKKLTFLTPQTHINMCVS